MWRSAGSGFSGLEDQLPACARADWMRPNLNSSGCNAALLRMPSMKAASGVFAKSLPALARLEPGHYPAGREHAALSLPSCGRAAGVERLFAKHQGMNPTGSFKDTGMTAAASFARQGGFRWVACASTGNTSASMAAYAARAGMRSLVLIPQGQITWGKLSQALDYGAVTCQLKTDFDGCMRVLDEVVERMPVYLLNSVNPYRLEGQKTARRRVAGTARLATAGPHHRARGKPGKFFGDRQGAAGDERAGPDYQPAEAFRDSGRRRQRTGADHARDRRQEAHLGPRRNHGNRHQDRKPGVVEKSGARA